MEFNGAKLAVICGGRVLSLLRDDFAGLPYAGMWDLPGGGREGAEGPEACALREMWEETGVRLDPSVIGWSGWYGDGAARVWFGVAEVGLADVRGVRLGDEGQALRWFAVGAFLAREDAIGHLRARLGDWAGRR